MSLANMRQQVSGDKPGGKPASAPVKSPAKAAPAPQQPKTFFQENKSWTRRDLTYRLQKDSRVIPGSGGAIYSREQVKKMIEKDIPYDKFQSYIKESEAKRVLKNLRANEFKAPTAKEKTDLNRERRYLEDKFGLRGKY